MVSSKLSAGRYFLHFHIRMTNVSTDWKVHEHLHVEQSEKIENTRRKSKELELRHSGHNGHHNLPMTVY